MKNKTFQNAGFSLIELLFAVLFLSVIVVGMIQLQTSSLRLANTQENRLKAALYSDQGLEILSAIDFEQVKNCNTICTLSENENDFTLQNNGSESLDNGLFKREIEKTQSLEQGFLISSIVSWEDSSGEHKTITKRIIFE